MVFYSRLIGGIAELAWWVFDSVIFNIASSEYFSLVGSSSQTVLD